MEICLIIAIIVAALIMISCCIAWVYQKYQLRLARRRIADLEANQLAIEQRHKMVDGKPVVGKKELTKLLDIGVNPKANKKSGTATKRSHDSAVKALTFS